MVMSPSPRLQLLGQCQLKFGAEPIELCRSGQRLLAFVGLRRRVCRTVIAGTLWPEVTEEHARGSLRTALWKLPRTDPALIRRGGGSLMISPSLGVDVHDLTDTALAVVKGREPPGVRQPLGALTGDDLLPGWDEEWVLVERERVRQLRLHALDALAEALTLQGKPALALEAAWESVRREPLRESAHRAVVTAHLAEGNLYEALRHYEAFRRLLNEELGVEPTSRFAGMLARAGALRTTDSRRERVPLPDWR